jgi:hypothetical protein
MIQDTTQGAKEKRLSETLVKYSPGKCYHETKYTHAERKPMQAILDLYPQILISKYWPKEVKTKNLFPAQAYAVLMYKLHKIFRAINLSEIFQYDRASPELMDMIKLLPYQARSSISIIRTIGRVCCIS